MLRRKPICGGLDIVTKSWVFRVLAGGSVGVVRGGIRAKEAMVLGWVRLDGGFSL